MSRRHVSHEGSSSKKTSVLHPVQSDSVLVLVKISHLGYIENRSYFKRLGTSLMRLYRNLDYKIYIWIIKVKRALALNNIFVA